MASARAAKGFWGPLGTKVTGFRPITPASLGEAGWVGAGTRLGWSPWVLARGSLLAGPAPGPPSPGRTGMLGKVTHPL